MKSKQHLVFTKKSCLLPFAYCLLLFSSIPTFCQDFQQVAIAPEVKSSFRGLSVVDNQVAWVSGSNGWVGRSVDGGNNFTFRQIPGFEKLDFRSLYAFDSLHAIIANAGSPAFILRTDDGGIHWMEVYQNNDKDAFFDGVDFWNEKEGVIYGDPLQGKMFICFTRDGGKTWNEASDKNRPSLKAGEASFAASGTGIRCLLPKSLVIATGGTVSRLWISNDKGMTWKTSEPPVVQGTASVGIFSVAVLDQRNFVVVGGDYKKDTLVANQSAYSLDGSKHWMSPSIPTGGYRECVEFVTKDVLVSTGPGGTDISRDGGNSWFNISSLKKFHTVRKARHGSLLVIVGNTQISIIDLKK